LGAEHLLFFRKFPPAFRYNLMFRTPEHKDFHCNRG